MEMDETFILPHFEYSSTLQGLIDHLYARAYGKSGCIYHMASFYYQFKMHDGKKDVEQTNFIFFPNNFLSLFNFFRLRGEHN